MTEPKETQPSSPDEKPVDSSKSEAEVSAGETKEAAAESDLGASKSGSDAEEAKKESSETKIEAVQGTPEGNRPGADDEQEVVKHAQHVSKILDEVLEESKATGGRPFRHPMILDLMLACGLLVAMGAFTAGLLTIYITHTAQRSIDQQNYKAAMAILKGSPLSNMFSVPGSDPQELLDQATYLDAMEKLEADGDDTLALRELTTIRPGSRFYNSAQQILKERWKPAPVTLEGQAQHEASPSDPEIPVKKPILPEEPIQGSP